MATIRALREEEIVSLCEMLSRAYKERPRGTWIEPEYFLQFILRDPSYQPEQIRVVEEDGQIASSVRIFNREIYGGLRLAGIGSVGTSPKYRGQGYATMLLKDAIRIMEEQGSDISILFTGSPTFYERVGWTRYPKPGTALTFPEPGQEEHPFAVRKLDPESREDLADMARLYVRTFSGLRGPVVRGLDYWRMWLVEWRWEMAEVWLADRGSADDPQGTDGYVVLEPGERRWTLLEYGSASPEALRFLAYFVSWRCKERGVEELYVPLPRGLGAIEFLLPYWRQSRDQPSSMMVRMVRVAEPVPEGLVYLLADHF